MDEQNVARKIWRPQSEGTIECRRCGCRHFVCENERVERGITIRYCHCRNCGKRTTLHVRP